MQVKDVVVDGLTESGARIRKVYFKVEPDYAIYRTRELIQLFVPNDAQPDSSVATNLQKIALSLASVYSLLPETLEGTEPINRQIARAVHTAVSGNAKDANAMLDEARERLKRHRIFDCRLKYASSNVVTAAVVATLALIASWYVSESYAECLRVCAFAAIGGFIAVATAYNSIAVDIDARNSLHCLLGASRILIAIAAGVAAYILVKADLAFGAVVSGDSSSYGVYAVGVIAGFSERLVPSLVGDLGGNKSEAAQSQEGG